MAADDNAGDGRKDRIDPRYDPAFQRGYRGEVRRSVRATPGRGERASAAQVTPQDRAQPQVQPPAEPTQQPLSTSQPAPAIPTTRTDPGADSRAGFGADSGADDAHDDGQLMPPPRVNPYVVALWVIGIVLSVGGVFLQWWAQMSQVSGAFIVQNGVPVRVLLISIANTVSGPMLTVGMATIVGLIFMLAVRHRRVSSSGVDPP